MQTAFTWVAGVAAVFALTTMAIGGGKGPDFEAQIKCSNAVGSPIANVTLKILNDADSGTAGNTWAFDTLERHITLWRTNATSTFCATVRDEGSFRTISGQRSPGNTANLTGVERGEIKGGYVAAITGTLLATPGWKTKGSIGTIDYHCDASGNCPGHVSWADQYFAAGYTFDQPWWGWVYRGGMSGTWVNAVSGNSGDIGAGLKGGGHHDDTGVDNGDLRDGSSTRDK